MSLLLHLHAFDHNALGIGMCLVHLEAVVSKQAEVMPHKYVPLF